MKERENRGVLDTANDHRVSSGAAEPGPRLNQAVQRSSSPLPGPHKTGYLRTQQDVFMLYINSCQGVPP